MKRDSSTLLCRGLPTIPDPELGTILVTGATGYIGGRLVPELLARGYRVRIMVRVFSPEHEQRWPGAQIVLGDALSPPCLKDAMQGVHTAYYLIHSLLLGPKEFESADTLAAINFRNAAKDCGVKRIIYLGGLGDRDDTLSPHLRSRMQVAKELQRGDVPVTTLRAAIIIGSGSAAYEIIKNLIKDAPILLLPRWINTRCQPIALRDIIKYLVGVLETPETTGRIFDIGGPDIFTYKDMINIMAETMGIKRVIFPSVISSVKFNSYIASLITPVPISITRCLIEGIVNEVVCRNNTIREMIPFENLGCKEAFLRAISREKTETVDTRWSDAYPRDHAFAVKLHSLPHPPKYISSYSIYSDKDAASLFYSICRIGGDEGWFNGNWMWRLRGMVDKIILGVGISRGRKSSIPLMINDVIDFWRIENLKKNEQLLLRAEMKLPGLAWLRFNLAPEGVRNRLTVRAYFRPSGILGDIYWYFFLPFHHFIFKDLLEQIELRCRAKERD